ncbi:MAG: M28 family peptidase [Candidatus Cloacimonetes bacterium]|nr:M28 family peptidase [Candidatus Cloacimonadota bacterium]
MRSLPFIIITTLFISACQRTPVFDGEQAFTHLIKQCEIGPRYPGSDEIIICREYIKANLEKSNAKIITQKFSAEINDSKYESENIIARFFPRQSRRIMLAAHYDTRPWADKDSNIDNHNTPIIGANDAASGVAVLLQIATILNKTQPSEFGVDLVFFDIEDMGSYGSNENWCLGSKYFAENIPIREPEKIILIDMIGDKDLEILMEQHSYHDSPILVNQIWEIAAEKGYKQFKRKLGQLIYDDHVPLLSSGLNAIDIIDFDYKYWHTLEDTPDKCSSESLQIVGQTLIEFIYQK